MKTNFTIKNGSIAELIVCADLLAKGYQVYRPVSYHSAFDIVAIRGSSIVTIEVRTSTEEDPSNFPRHKERSIPMVYASVTKKTNRINYFPDVL